jgi:acetate kinase
MSQLVLVLNCGSSSIKFAIVNSASGKAELSGLAENLFNDDATLVVKRCLKQDPEKTQITLEKNSNHTQALSQINRVLDTYPELKSQLAAIGHRVVHGGETFTEATLINNEVKQAIEATSHMAPLHNPANLAGIESAQEAFPHLPHVAVFDTAFFQSMPKIAYLYALPHELYKKHGIRRYGFHGSSHEFVCEQAAEMLNKPISECNLITAHLGNGCSIAAIKQGKAVDTSLGFTPLEGLVMGTRCGDIDPSLPSYIQERLQLNAQEVTTLLNKSSGLLGLSEVSNDCRTLEQLASEGHELASLALDIFCYRLAKYIGSYLVAAGPLDALVFTGGIGENSSFIRETTCKHLAHLGFTLDAELNSAMRFGARGQINPNVAGKAQNILVIPTNEEWVISQKAIELLASPKQSCEQI